MGRIKTVILVLAAAALAGAGIYFVKYGNYTLTGQAGSGASGAAGAPPALDLFGNPVGSPGTFEVGLPAEAGGPTSADGARKPHTYTHPDPAFSFTHPENFSVSAFNDETGETVLARGGSEKENFQIYITPFDEEGPVTAERIREDIPDMVIESPKNIVLGVGGSPDNSSQRHPERSEGSPGDSSALPQNDGGVPALAFLSGDAQSRTREVWFAQNGYLYQITAYPEFDGGLSGILLTWRFQ